MYNQAKGQGSSRNEVSRNNLPAKHYKKYIPVVEVRCYTCNEKGHYAYDCPKSGKGSRMLIAKVCDTQNEYHEIVVFNENKICSAI